MKIYQVSGVEDNGMSAPQVWFAYARSKASAENLMRVFSSAGYLKIKLSEVEAEVILREVGD